MKIYTNRTWDHFKSRPSRAIWNADAMNEMVNDSGSVGSIYGNDNEDKNERIQTRGWYRRTTARLQV